MKGAWNRPRTTEAEATQAYTPAAGGIVNNPELVGKEAAPIIVAHPHISAARISDAMMARLPEVSLKLCQARLATQDNTADFFYGTSYFARSCHAWVPS